MDHLPVRLARHRISVALPQVANIVRLLKLLDRPGIVLILAIVDLQRAHILVAAMHRFNLPLAPQLLGNARRRNSQSQQDEEDCHDQGNQHEALFLLPRDRLFGDRLHR